MKTSTSRALSFLVILPLTACDILADGADDVGDGINDGVDDVGEGINDVGDGIDDTVDDVEPDDLRAAFEDAIFEKLQCEELARPSTLARIRDLLRDPTLEEVQALVTNPQDLATVVAMGGAEIEGAVVVARNLERLLADGTARALLEGGWDGVSCGEAVPFACTAGEETTTVACDPSVSAVSVELDQCTLGGTVHDGAFTFTRGAEGTAHLAFEELAFDEVKVLDGSLTVAVGALGVHATLGERLTYGEHGGPEGGLECGARLSLDALELDVDTTASIEFAGARSTTSDTLAIATTSPLRFAGECACPLPGGGLAVEVPRPLGRAGESATAQIAFTSSTDPGLCAEANVTLVGWPTLCEADLSGDCAKGATQAVLSKVFTTLCALP